MSLAPFSDLGFENGPNRLYFVSTSLWAKIVRLKKTESHERISQMGNYIGVNGVR